MNEQNFDIILKCVRATDVCLDGVNTALKALYKQGKRNRVQRLLNLIFAACTVTSIKRIGELVENAVEQNQKIEKLETEIAGLKNKEGE